MWHFWGASFWKYIPSLGFMIFGGRAFTKSVPFLPPLHPPQMKLSIWWPPFSCLYGLDPTQSTLVHETKRVELKSNKTPFVLLVSKKWQKIYTNSTLLQLFLLGVKLLNIGSYEMVNKCAYMASLPFPLLDCLAPNMQWQQ